MADLAIFDPNDFGITLELTLKDAAGVAQDISAASATVIVAQMPGGGGRKTWTATWKTDGTDGVVSYALIDGDLGKAGLWKLQVRATFAGKVVTSSDVTLQVG